MNIETLALRFDPTKGLTLLDQTLLPNQKVFLKIKTLDEMIEAIQSLRVRGAPLIGISASLFWGYWLTFQQDPYHIRLGFEKLRSARPTAVNLMNNLDECWQSYSQNPHDKKAALKKAFELFHQDQKLCEKMSEYGSSLIEPHDLILTYCNTGELATAGIGTALGAIKKAHEQKKAITVYSCETRPLGQGARLTLFELSQAKIPCYLICDNTAAFLMKNKKVTKVFVGADRITTKGDVANKIGTYSLALAAHFHNIPFYVVAPSTTLDSQLHDGDHIHIEMRSDKEILSTWQLSYGKCINPGFDVTPASLITKIITEKGIFNPHDIQRTLS